MAFLDGALDRSDWWDASAYAYTSRLTRRGWAWEFLRRNPGFQRDLETVLEQAVSQEQDSSLNIVSSQIDLSKWGVMFGDFTAF